MARTKKKIEDDTDYEDQDDEIVVDDEEFQKPVKADKKKRKADEANSSNVSEKAVLHENKKPSKINEETDIYLRDLSPNQRGFSVILFIKKRGEVQHAKSGTTYQSFVCIDKLGQRVVMMLFNENIALASTVEQSAWYRFFDVSVNIGRPTSNIPDYNMMLFFNGNSVVEVLKPMDPPVFNYVFKENPEVDTIVDMKIKIISQKNGNSYDCVALDDLLQKTFNVTLFEPIQLPVNGEVIISSLMCQDFRGHISFKSTAGTFIELLEVDTIDPLTLTVEAFLKDNAKVALIKGKFLKVEHFDVSNAMSPVKKPKQYGNYNIALIFSDAVTSMEVRMRMVAEKLFKMSPQKFYELTEKKKNEVIDAFIDIEFEVIFERQLNNYGEIVVVRNIVGQVAF